MNIVEIILFLIPYILTFIAGGLFGMILMACVIAGSRFEDKVNKE